MATDFAFGARERVTDVAQRADDDENISFVVDSGCSKHMTNDETGYTKIGDVNREVTVASGKGVMAGEQ